MSVSGKTALGGIFASLVMLLLYLASTVPTSRLFLLSLCSFAVSVIIVEAGRVYGLIFYGATSVLGFLLVPDKAIAVLYILFFGIYGLAKAVIEEHATGLFQYILKLIVFNLCFLTIYLFAGLIIDISTVEIKLAFPLWMIIAGLQAAFLLYDRVFTTVISYYCSHLHGKIR